MLGEEELHREGSRTETGPGAAVESLLLEVFRTQPGRALSNQLHLDPVASKGLNQVISRGPGDKSMAIFHNLPCLFNLTLFTGLHSVIALLLHF